MVIATCFVVAACREHEPIGSDRGDDGTTTTDGVISTSSSVEMTGTGGETTQGDDTTGADDPFPLEHDLLWKVTRDDGGGFPYRVVGLGDVNGDGLGDFAVAGNGKTFVVFGKEDMRDVRTEDVETGIGGFVISYSPGKRLAAAGDVNGDGLADILLGKVPCHSPPTDPGGLVEQEPSSCDLEPPDPEEQTFVIFGKIDGGPVELDAVVGGEGGYVIVGAADHVAGGHDANGDGLADVLVVAGGNTKYRDKFLVLGKGDGAPILLADSETDGRALRFEGEGNRLDFVGDFDGDGFVDIAVSAPYHDEYYPSLERPYRGLVYVVYGTGEPRSVILDDIAAENDDTGTLILGYHNVAVGSARVMGIPGDVNGDGADDLVIHQGDWIVVLGAPEREWVWLPDLNEPNDRVLGTMVRRHLNGYGYGAVAALGDLDGDGLDDVARTVEIPAPPPDGWILPEPPWGPSEGCVDVLLGAGEPVAAWFTQRVRCELDCGWSLAGEDVNGSGFRELLAIDQSENVVLVYGFSKAAR